MAEELDYATETKDNGTVLRYSHGEALAEALLFAKGGPVPLEDIATLLVVKYTEAEKLLDRLAARYEAQNGGLVLKKFNGQYQLASRPALHEELKPYFEQVFSSQLSRAALETLTIIAYSQPITRGGIETVRGVSSDSVVSTLLERGLICEVGRSESPGRPVLYGTSDLFLKSTGISSIEELKAITPVLAEEEPDSASEGENSADPVGDVSVKPQNEDSKGASEDYSENASAGFSQV